MPLRPVPKPVTLRSLADKYQEWIRTLPCIVHGCRSPSVAHHAGGPESGRGKDHKGSDFRCLPMCGDHHDEWHWGKERFCLTYGIDPNLAIIERLEVYAYNLERRDRA